VAPAWVRAWLPGRDVPSALVPLPELGVPELDELLELGVPELDETLEQAG
jgi:hypothetical protein